jgi:LacI family transcriptional regulator, galactose operon repressor
MTIKDIAKKAGVSVATVSHVINKTRYVSEVLQEKVIRIMKELDYQPNHMAGSLRRKRTKTIGLIIPDNSNPLYADLASAIEDVLFKYDFTLMLCNSEHDLTKELTYIKALRSKRADGLIIIPASAQADHINRLIENGLPIVILDRPIPDLLADSVFIDHFQGMYDAAAYLLKLGHKRIAYIDKKFHLPHKFSRLEGFHRALADHGGKFFKSLYREAGVSFEDGAMAMMDLLVVKPLPTAVLCFDDVIAMGAMRAIKDEGLSIPKDIAVIGFDDMPLCSFTVPRLTTVYYPRHEMAEIACKFLMRRIEGKGRKKKNETVLPVHLVVRESTPELKGKNRVRKRQPVHGASL